MTAPAVRTVACPHCGRPSPYEPGNRWRPFCSQRCRAADLGDWASERFRIADPAPAPDAASASTPPPPAEH